MALKLVRDIAAAVAASDPTHDDEHGDVQTAVNAAVRGAVVYDPVTRVWVDADGDAVEVPPAGPARAVGGVQPPPWLRYGDVWTPGQLDDGPVLLHETWPGDVWPATRWSGVDASSTASGGVGTIATVASGGGGAVAHNTIGAFGDYEWYQELTLQPGFDQVNNTTLEFYLRRTSNDYYQMLLHFTLGELRIRRYDNNVLNGATSQPNRQQSFVVGRLMRLLMRHVGNDLWIKVWHADEPEPDHWPIKWTDDQPSPHTSGALWYRLANGGAETDANAIAVSASTIIDPTVVLP